MYYSQFKQDEILHKELFKNNRNGVFCDIGAHDGISISNTYFFEKELGWGGLCVEAHPDNYEKLTQNRSCNTVFGAAYNRYGTITFRTNDGYTNMLSGVDEAYSDIHMQRLNRELKSHGGSSKTRIVPCFILKTIFEMHLMKTIDYMSIDTEGSELQVLQGIDFNKVHINVIDFEVNYPGSEKHNKIKELLTTNGFKYWKNIMEDEVWLNRNLKFTWERESPLQHM